MELTILDGAREARPFVDAGVRGPDEKKERERVIKPSFQMGVDYILSTHSVPTDI